MTAILLKPDWPAPVNVHAVCSTRQGGCSQGPYASLNLGNHVGDSAAAVAANRQRFAALAAMPVAPVWLNQVHGTEVVTVLEPTTEAITADASITRVRGVVSCVMTADCLPLLLCDQQGTQVAAIHAGWRGLCDGIIERALQQFAQPARVMAYLGPAIGPAAFEVGAEVKAAFIAQQAQAASAFTPAAAADKWLADIYTLARQRLASMGVTAIYGGHYCTYSQSELFFSYRRDGQTGRMASAIWLS